MIAIADVRDCLSYNFETKVSPLGFRESPLLHSHRMKFGSCPHFSGSNRR